MPIPKGRLAAAFSLVLVLVAAGGTLSTVTMVSTMRDVRTALQVHTELLQDTEWLRLLRERKGRQVRNYLLTSDTRFLDEVREARQGIATTLQQLHALVNGPRAAELLAEVGKADGAHNEVLDRFVRLRQTGESLDALGPELDAAVGPHRRRLDRALLAFEEHAKRTVLEERGRLLSSARRSMLLLLALVPSTLALALVLVALVLRIAGQLRASEAALANQLARSQEANRDLDAFAGRVAHDFRGLLSPLSMLAEMLRGPKAGDRVGQVADRMTRLANRADRELEALLAFARGGRDADRSASAPLRRAVEQAVEDLAHAITAADAAVSIEVDDVGVAVSPGLLQAVVFNLLGNAIKFLAGQPRRAVRVRGGREDRSGVLEIEDTGPGISPDARAHVFEPFYRGPGASANGTGLGLAIVHRIVQAHDGEVTFRSVAGEGTTFRIVLPLAEGTPAAAKEGPLPHAS